ncbi:aminodeoxychorismate synthase, subunit II [Acetoanaerobium sticklandii]|uniref:Aminodeoxychorismate synthase, subunit II n=1 Tax=Acetoanaerobium sticklandii (strain ATCC 12662 / DSM 519 / JCM 1433 / CCUG 9281 / NCIMB 10654 / HF) TaxID=499177 RepID=E3PTB0_ACESD|nr:aminodeoxychorismate/anthranilate synthase component II [Acetoanaerobium sticklandii]CBH22114.1 aminodeoxychorismate synthase, subunit II [Acetoanaerobium sticklandii]
MILLIDNYDSFSFNLYQIFGSIEPNIRVIRNDELTVDEIDLLSPEAIILSPGPGRPEDAGVCMEVIKKLGHKYPLLGICLGHQAICSAYGLEIVYAKQLMHGRQSEIILDKENTLFNDCKENILVARYHSLAASDINLSNEISIIARAEDGEIMAVKHKKLDIYGLQFHPESVMTDEGAKIIKNFLEIARKKEIA